MYQGERLTSQDSLPYSQPCPIKERLVGFKNKTCIDLEETEMKNSTCQSSLNGQLSLQPTQQKETDNVYTLVVEYDVTDRTRK